MIESDDHFLPAHATSPLTGSYCLREATNTDGPAVWGLISRVLQSYGITPNLQTTDIDLADIEANYWRQGGAFFVLLDEERIPQVAGSRVEPRNPSPALSGTLSPSDGERAGVRGLPVKSGFKERVIGTVALHRETDAVCELCRMYLAPQFRGRGLGRRLLEHSLHEARARGFEEVRLKTASVLVEAIALYRRAGFVPVEGAEVGGNCDLVMRRRLDG